MLLGLIRPSSGKAYLNGEPINPDNSEMWKKVGYLVEVPYSYPDLTVHENLDIVRKLRLISNTGSVQRIINLMKLEPYSDVKAKNLSLGNAQRLGLAKALIHDPEILVLDEPANGLDPEGIIEIREMLRDLAEKRGVTIFISSHILGEISRFATRIGIIHEGKLLYESLVTEMENLRRNFLHLRTRDPAGTAELLRKYGYNSQLNEKGILEVTGKDAIENPEKIAVILVNTGIPPSLLKVEEEDLESFFLRVIHMKKGSI
jgi:ABC-2 type transport system ATP-binding protein